MQQLSIGDKFKVNGIEGYITEHEATKVINGAYVEIEGYDCWKREVVICASYSEADIKERQDYLNAPFIKEGERVLIGDDVHTLEIKGDGQGFDFAIMSKHTNEGLKTHFASR